MSSKDSFVFYQPGSRTVLYDMKKKGQLSDVSIKIDDKVFAAHRIILAAAVPYFRTKFTSNLAESREKEVTMKGLDPIAVECLIDFAYTSKVTITVENVESLMVASEYLQLTQVRDSCYDFLSKRLYSNNAMNARDLAVSLNCLALVKNADSYLTKNFETFSQTKEDNLEVSSEERVFGSMVNWVQTDAKKRKLLPESVTRVCMPFHTPHHLPNVASKEKPIVDSVPGRNLLEAKDYHLLPEGESDCSFTVSEGGCEKSAECGIYLFCCSEENGLTVFKYIATSGKWNTVLNDRQRTDLLHVLVLGAEIYVFTKNTFEAFNPRTLTWTPRATFPSTYSNFNLVIPCNGKIYWFGHSQHPYQGICFDNQSNQWLSYAHPNLCINYDDELVPSGDCVYVFGSHYGSDPTKRRIVMYNLRTQAVTHIPRMQYDRFAFASTVLNDAVYVCGGVGSYRDAYFCREYPKSFDYEHVSRSTEIYSSYRGWRTASLMNKPKKYFSLLTYKGKLYAIGGTEVADLVDVYDPAADKWSLVGGFLGDCYDFVKAVAIPD